MTLGERIAQRRKQLNITQSDLAKRLYTNQSQIWRYESNKNSPTADVLLAIAEILDVTPDWLLGLTDVMNPVYPDTELNPTEIELLELYRSKPPETQNRIIQVVKVL